VALKVAGEYPDQLGLRRLRLYHLRPNLNPYPTLRPPPPLPLSRPYPYPYPYHP
jgi:hypothetical protein